MACSAGWIHTLFLGARTVALGIFFMDSAVEFRVRMISLTAFTIFLCCYCCRLSLCFFNNPRRATRQNSKLKQSEESLQMMTRTKASTTDTDTEQKSCILNSYEKFPLKPWNSWKKAGFLPP